MMKDPRPDLKEDHKYWQILLTEAEKIGGGCAGTLHGIRCGGGKLKMTNGSLKLKPRIGSNRWASQDEWKEDRERWLLPKKEQFVKIFRKASRKCTLDK